MEGNGGAAYFQFRLPPGVALVFLLVRVLASDDPENSIDFYATRNTPWTKNSPERVDLESSHILPILTKDADSSIQAADYEISSSVVCFFQRVGTNPLCYSFLALASSYNSQTAKIAKEHSEQVC